MPQVSAATMRLVVPAEFDVAQQGKWERDHASILRSQSLVLLRFENAVLH